MLIQIVPWTSFSLKVDSCFPINLPRGEIIRLHVIIIIIHDI